MRIRLWTVAQILGALAMSVGAGMVFSPAGIFLAGLFGMLFGVAAERAGKD